MFFNLIFKTGIFRLNDFLRVESGVRYLRNYTLELPTFNSIQEVDFFQNSFKIASYIAKTSCIFFLLLFIHTFLFSTTAQAQNPPLSVTAASNSCQTAQVTWTAPSTGAPVQYIVTQSPSGGTPIAPRTVTGTTLSQFFYNLPVGTYTWSVAANDGSVSSSAVSATPLAIALCPVQHLASCESTDQITPALILRMDGSVWSWGDDTNGLLGLSRSGSSTYIEPVWGVGPGSNIIQVAQGDGFSQSYGLRNDGAIYAWGYNVGYSAVQLANFGPGSGVIKITTSETLGDTHSHLVVLKSNGSVYTEQDEQAFPGSLPVLVIGAGSGIAQLSGAYGSTYALRSDGAVFAWGDGQYGQMGNGGTANNLGPTQIPSFGAGSGITQISSGLYTGYALKSDGTVYSWGYGADGELGNGGVANALTPVQVSGFGAGSNVRSISSGLAQFGRDGQAVKSDGTAYTWGYNNYGQLANGNTTNSNIPVFISNGVDTSSAGVVVKTDGTVLSTGGNGDGTGFQRYQLGQMIGPDSVGYLTGAGICGSLPPTGVTAVQPACGVPTVTVSWTAPSSGAPTNYIITQYPAGGAPAAPVTVSGATLSQSFSSLPAATYSWSVVANTPPYTSMPAFSSNSISITGCLPQHPVSCETSVLSSEGGENIALKSDGTVLAWGQNGYGGLGNGLASGFFGPLYPTPAQVTGLGIGSNIIQVNTNGYTSYALRNDGYVFGWGYGANGQFGNGGTASSYTPVQVGGWGAGSGVIQVASAFGDLYAVKSDGSVYATGDNYYGQIGNNSTATVTTPVQIFAPGSGIIQVIPQAGYATVFALKRNGTVYSWGKGDNGVLGNGSTAEIHVPMQIPSFGAGSGITKISAGYWTGYALKNDGTVYSWGYGGRGALGNGTLVDSFTPVQVSGFGPGSNVRSITGGATSTVTAVENGGDVFGWGDNFRGQLGNGTASSDPTKTPIFISTGGDVTVGSSPSDNTYILKPDGTVVSVGLASGGGLGDGIARDPLATPPNPVVAATHFGQVVGVGGAGTILTGITPSALACPSPPTGVAAVQPACGVTTATINWLAPLAGGPYTSYTVTSSPGGLASTVTGNPAPITTTVSGLAIGTAYTFSVTASNIFGTSVSSVASNSITPVSCLVPPSSPTGVTAVQPACGVTTATINWTASTGAPTSYTVTAA